MPFVDKVKKLIRTFLGTQDEMYILTEDGRKLQISDFSYNERSINAGTWTDKTSASGSWTDKPKSS